MKITIETDVAAPIDEVWRAFNDPDDIVQWDAGDGWRAVWATNDLQVGGRLLLRIDNWLAETQTDFAATYTRIEINKLIEFREDGGRMVRVEFTEKEGGVTLRQSFDADAETPAEFQRAEWQGVLDSFARHVEHLIFESPAQNSFQRKCEAASDYQGDDDYDEATFHQLMRVARQALPAYAEDVLAADTQALYSDLNSDIERTQWFEESFPADNFALLTKIIRDPRFLKTRNGWHFLMIFEAEWKKITAAQKVVLLATLGEIYENFEDWMPCFSISELVGENYDSAQALAFFDRFAGSSNETARSFVPHGYEHALRNSADAKLTASLWAALSKMESDKSEKVRGEVEETLQRLEYHGLQRP